MKRVSILLLLIVAVFALGLNTDEMTELFLFLILLILFVLTISLTRYVQRYLIMKRIEKDCRDVFTEEFYNRLKKTVLKNEFKVSDDKLCSRQAKNK